MEKFNKRIIICLTLIALIFIILIPTIYKLITDYHQDSYLVVEKKATEAAQKCWNDQVCLNESVTLKELYNNGYLETLVNPISKKIYDENSTIKKSNGKIVISLH